MSERLTKKQLKEDHFLDSVQTAVAYARDHTAIVVAGVLGFLILVVLAVRIGGQAAGVGETFSGNPEAQRALGSARAEFASGRLDAGTAALEDVRRRWNKEDAGREATYVLGNAYFEAGDWENSRRTFEEFLADPLHDELLRDGARMGIAACREESGDAGGALDDYAAIWLDGTTPGTRIQAALSGARCAVAAGRPDRAREFLQGVLDGYPAAPEATEAEFELLRLAGGKAS